MDNEDDMWEYILSDDMNGWVKRGYQKKPKKKSLFGGRRTDYIKTTVYHEDTVALEDMVEGDWYKITKTSTPFKYISHDTKYMVAEYEKSGLNYTNLKPRYYKAEEKETEMTKKLYEFEINFKTHYGHKLAVNSEGKWVMEVKGQSAPVAVDKEDVQEVIPYSIGIRFTGGNTQVYHYTADKGKFEKGLYLFNSPSGLSLCEVVELDTKSKMATKEFAPALKVVTEVIK